MSNHHQIDLLIEWISNFNPQLLQNEDDVETKFVLPFFQLLGYPENNRRGKYPIKTYQPGKKQGRDPEADHVYFSTNEQEKQNAETSLIIVEAKKPTEKNLEPHIKQAKFYGDHLKSVFLVITNGYQVKVLKRPRHRIEESIFDINIDELKDRKIASEFYKQLNFEIVKQINENTANDLTHSQYVSLEKALQCHPHIQAILDKGDFEPSITRGKNYLRVVKAKVAIECNLPTAFDEGDCTIEFSSIILRGSTIYLSHQEILGNLMMGLKTKSHCGTRSFLRKLEDNYFEASLSGTTVILSAAETQDLCDCVDEVFSEYKRIIIESENILEASEFEPVNLEYFQGFKLFSVTKELWKLMLKFVREFSYDDGNSNWHIFEKVRYIKVCRPCSRSNYPEQTNVWPSLNPNIDSYYSIDIIYFLSSYELEFFDKYYDSWQKNVGHRGFWTATYTKKWLLEKFIPKVLDYYFHNRDQTEFEDSILDDAEEKLIPIKKIYEASQLKPYICYIQQWTIRRSKAIDASLLYSYYQTCTNLVRDSEVSETHYITGKLRAIKYKLSSKNERLKFANEGNWSYERVVNFLDQQVERISNLEFENSSYVDLMSRTFSCLLESEDDLHYSQAQLNAAKNALIPLWELSRFEEHHVYPNRYQ
ncbi:MAG: type I restriction enzyme HsdR N-terminal domain-containing protein [Okeania sp. SIO2C9]|uniref:type I restriction enzyme HsdR N-terminal domain-containing protein n=1 Tax=Okeania sp. SIO2C9 TaxID=2607791 RepID=UPI0013C00995|nr:type I restriction enzyme HsdR N-terminal domain-containing protein [Okeania sp. SIO2C9]NEQ75043.1 type I restriction enzyme HsdR N-terminal domain-containing protein [Okeania sp. SIO2C9]